MPIIAVVKKNNCDFTEIEKYARPLLYRELAEKERRELKTDLNNYIWSVIEPYIEFIDVPIDDFIAVVCQQVTSCYPDKSYGDFFYHTEGSYSFPKKYVEFIYAQPLWKTYTPDDKTNMNHIGCLFSLKHHVIENNCIIFANKYDLSAPHFAVIDSITKEDIIRVIRRRFFFTAVLIKNDSMVKYYYQNPGYLVSKVYGLGEKDSIQKLSYSHLKYNLLFYFQYDKTKYLNKIATRINGMYQLHGDILMLHELEENVYANISIKEAKRLNVLSYGRLYDRELKKEEVHTIKTFEPDSNGNEVEKNLTPYWSRYIVIEARMKKWQLSKNQCINCSKEMVKPIVCQKCYRAKYCSSKCLEEFAHYHTDECINPKSME